MTSTVDESVSPASPPSESGARAQQAAQAAQAAPATRSYPIGEELSRAVKRSFLRAQTGLHPAAAGGGLAVLGHALHSSQSSPWLGAAIPAGVFVAALTQEKVRTWLGKAAWRRVWAGGCLAFAAAWTPAAARAGVDMTTLLPSALAAGGSLLAAPWWWTHRWVARARWEGLSRAAKQPAPDAGTPAAQVDAVPERPAIEAGPHAHQLRWEETLGRERDLNGTRLEQPEQLFDHCEQENGLAWIINGTASRVSWETMFRNLGNIYAAYDAPGVENLIHLERERERWETRARLVILERDPLIQKIEWERPGLDRGTGRIPFAIYPDGSGWAPYTLYVPGWGTPHDQVIGETGSGKGGALRLIAIETLVFGSRLLLFDPHGNGALEEATGLVRTPLVTPQEMIAGMRGVEAALEERIRIRNEVGKQRFGPDHGHMPLHVMLDEATKVLTLDREIGRIVSRVYREGRKFWIKGTLADQSTAFGDYLGNQGVEIRGQAQGGASILYRISPEEARRTNPGVDLPVPLHKLPQWIDEDAGVRFTGLGYVLGTASRVLKSRTQWVPDAAFAAWCPPISRQVLDDRTEEAFQTAYEAAMGGMDGSEGDTGQRDDPPPSNVTSLYAAGQDNDEQAKRLLLEFIAERGGRATRAEISDARICPSTQALRLLADMAEVNEVRRGEYELRAS